MTPLLQYTYINPTLSVLYDAESAQIDPFYLRENTILEVKTTILVLRKEYVVTNTWFVGCRSYKFKVQS